MRILKIRKRSGGVRTVVCPSARRKAACRALIARFTSFAQPLSPPGVVHGFMPLRSPVTNARMHVGFRYTLTMDLKDFFDSVRWEKMDPRPATDGDARKAILHEGVARQGLPTSPILANIAAATMDREIIALNGGHDATVADVQMRFAYTRYADDLTFSFDHPALGAVLIRRVTEIAKKHGFAVNTEKTRLQAAEAGRRIVTGIAVGDGDIYPTRAAKRRLRAARHQGAYSHAAGLAEWCRLRQPRIGRRALRRRMDGRHHATEKLAEAAEHYAKNSVAGGPLHEV